MEIVEAKHRNQCYVQMTTQAIIGAEVSFTRHTRKKKYTNSKLVQTLEQTHEANYADGTKNIIMQLSSAIEYETEY